MKVTESVRMSWRAIQGHKLRSVLTVLGVVIGVGSVITFVTLGASLQAAVVGDVATSSPDIAVSVGPASEGGQGGPGGGEDVPVFTEHDVEQLQGIENVDAVVPTGQVGISSLEYRDDTVRWPSMTATTAASFDEFQSGEAFTAGENETVLNPAASTMFAENVSAGDEITIEVSENDTRTVTVAGVLNESSGFAAVAGGGGTPTVYVPTDPFYTTTAESPATGERERAYPQVTIRASSYEQVDSVEPPARDYLENESDASQLKPDSYEITLTTNDALVEQIQSILSMFTSFITGIAVISLLVGAIGIANMMLVSVTERTREIGIMKAIGATRRDIVQLFLVESIILGVIGSVIGTLVGLAGGYAVAAYLEFPVAFAPEWFAIAVAVGIGVGVLAGIYPAWDAARTDPIDALRHE